MKNISLTTPPTPSRLSKPTHWSRALLAVCTSAIVTATAFAAPSTTVVISQVYGGGNNSGATYRNDFIELHNISNSPVSVDGWSVQYAATSGISWTVGNLAGTIPAGAYYLISASGGTTNGVALPTADATASTINLSATNGKVVLSNSTTAFAVSNPSGASVIDFVGYGTANFFEGTAAPAGTNANSLTRLDFGSTDTDNNSLDFTPGVASARNSSSPIYIPIPSSGPTIAAPASIPAFSTIAGIVSLPQSFTVVGTNLTANIDLVASAGFEVSNDGTNFASAATLPLAGGTGYARVSSTAAIGPVTGSITLSSTGATNKTIGLTGTVGDPNLLTVSFLPTSIPEDSVTPATGTVSIPVMRATDLVVTLESGTTSAVTVPPTVTITANQLTATFNATPVTAPTSFVTNSSLVTASAVGMTPGSATLQVTNVDLPPGVSVALTSSPYTQNFDNLGVVAFPGAVSSTVGNHASLGALAGSPLNGWYVTKIAGDGNAPTSITPDNGTLANGLVNNYGTTAATDRALGVLASGSNAMAMGALITNNTGGTLTGLSLSMTAEFWRSSTSSPSTPTPNTLTFGYGKIAGDITTSNFLSIDDIGVLPLVGLDIVGPTPVTSNGALDGNASGNQVAFTSVSLPVALAPGESVFIRWKDNNDTGSDAGLAIDNLVISGVSPAPGNTYSSWASTNTGSGSTSATGDHDNDGVTNGVEFFMGATGSTFTPNPVPDANRLLSIPASATATGVTGTIQTSPDLVTWTTLSSTTAGGFISATIPAPDAGGKIFARLNVVVTTP